MKATLNGKQMVITWNAGTFALLGYIGEHTCFFRLTLGQIFTILPYSFGKKIYKTMFNQCNSNLTKKKKKKKKKKLLVSLNSQSVW